MELQANLNSENVKTLTNSGAQGSAPKEGAQYESADAGKYLSRDSSAPNGLTALVLSGGGSRGAYQVGVWQALNELGFRFDMVVGVSAGALNGAMVCQGDQVQAANLWRQIEADQVFGVESGAQPVDYVKEFMKTGGSGISSEPLQKLIHEYAPEDALRESPVDLGILTIELPAFKPHYLWKEDVPAGQLDDFIVASASVFPGIKPMRIDGVDYIDGGAINVMPIHMAAERGAKHIVAVYLKAAGIVDMKKELASCEDITLIEPHYDLGSFLVFDPDNSKRILRLGYLDAMKAFGVYDGGPYFAFVKDAFDKRTLKQADCAAHIFELDPLILYRPEFFLAKLQEAVRAAAAELDAATAEIEETQKKMRSTRKNALLQLDLKKRFEELSLAAGLSLENVNQLFSQLNRKNTVLFIARDIAEKKQDSFFIRRPALRVFAEEVAAARFISKYIEF